MKTIYLLRHAKAKQEADDGGEDFDRPLSRRGRAAAGKVGHFLAEKGFAPAQVLCSPARRTQETLERLQETLDVVLPARFEKALYLAEEASLLRRLKRLNDTLGSTMLVGHNPGLHRLALALAKDGDRDARRSLEVKFPTAGLAVIEVDVERWADLSPGCGRLSSFIRPQDGEG